MTTPVATEPHYDLAHALTIAARLARRYGASTLSQSGNRVWVSPSRVSWQQGAYVVLVTGDAPGYELRPAYQLETCADMGALVTRLARGGLSASAPIWRVEVMAEPETVDGTLQDAPTDVAREYAAVALPLAGTFG